MPNDFEKQVRQKMDELDFVPGEPVWTNIEAQIRRKKDRRRVIFWLPLFLLMAGGAGVWLSQHRPEATTTAKDSEAGTVSASTSSRPVENANRGSNEKNGITQDQPIDRLAIAVRPSVVMAKSEPSTSKKTRQAETALTLKNSKSQGTTSVPLKEVKDEATGNQDGVEVSIPAINNESVVNPSEKEVKKTAKKDSAAIIVPDSIQTVTTGPKKKQKSKWQIAAVGFAGFSGLADGLTVLNMEKSADMYSGNLTSSPVYTPSTYTPASIEKGFSFSIGASAMKQLSEKFRLSAGLEYNFLSNKLQAGVDSAGYVRAFTTMANNSSGANTYTNHFHFISLPVDIAFIPLKKLPLDISAGIALQQLIATDGLVYQSQYHAYTQDKKSFTKTQMFTRFGVNYSVSIDQHKLLFGPQLNYGLSNLLNNGTDTHLFSFGLRTAFIF